MGSSMLLKLYVWVTPLDFPPQISECLLLGDKHTPYIHAHTHKTTHIHSYTVKQKLISERGGLCQRGASAELHLPLLSFHSGCDAVKPLQRFSRCVEFPQDPVRCFFRGLCELMAGASCPCSTLNAGSECSSLWLLPLFWSVSHDSRPMWLFCSLHLQELHRAWVVRAVPVL